MKMNWREAIRNLTYSTALFGLPASVFSAETQQALAALQ